jgi:hypothetical protein
MAEATDESCDRVKPWNPFTSRRVWLAVLALFPLYAIWMFCHFPSYAIFNGVVAGFGPIFVSFLAGIVKRDWRFIGMGVGYATFVSAVVYWVFMGPI